MSRHPFALCLLGLCLAPTLTVRADDFSWELAGAASESKLDPLLDTDRSSLQATYYFGGVDDSQGPYALASFFDPKTRVGVSIGHEKQTSHPIVLDTEPFQTVPAISIPIGNIVGGFLATPLDDVVSETTEYTVSGRYVFPSSKWYFGGSYEERDFENPSLLLDTVSIDANAYGVLAGKYFGDATTLELAWHSSERRMEEAFGFCVVTLFCVTAEPIVAETETNEASIAALHVRRFRSLTYALSGRVAQTSGHVVARFPEISIEFPPFFVPIRPVVIPSRTVDTSLDRFETYSVGAELFPTAKLGVRVGYSDWSSDAPAGEYAYDVATTWFFRRNVGLQFAFSRERSPDDSNISDNDTAAFRVIGRL